MEQVNDVRTKLSEYLPISRLAKAVHMAPARVLKICKEEGIAIEWGGSKKCRLLRARLCDFERVVEKRVYVDAESVPPPRPRRRTSSGKPLNPRVTC